MSAKKKAKKRLPKPVLAWCIMDPDGPILPDNCYSEKSMAEYWANADGDAIIRVRITPVAKRRKGAPR